MDEALGNFRRLPMRGCSSQLHRDALNGGGGKALNQAITSNRSCFESGETSSLGLIQCWAVPSSLGADRRGAIEDSLLDASVRFAAQAIAAPVELNLAPLRGTVNSEAPEYYPALFATGDRMIFTRQIGGDARMTGQEDFFEAKLSEDGTWNVSRELSEINTSGNEGAPTVRGDGRQLIFTACDGLDGRYGRRTGQGGCDLFYADLDVENRFQRETNLEAVNSKAWESQPR